MKGAESCPLRAFIAFPFSFFCCLIAFEKLFIASKRGPWSQYYMFRRTKPIKAVYLASARNFS